MSLELIKIKHCELDRLMLYLRRVLTWTFELICALTYEQTYMRLTVFALDFKAKKTVLHRLTSNFSSNRCS